MVLHFILEQAWCIGFLNFLQPDGDVYVKKQGNKAITVHHSMRGILSTLQTHASR